MIDEMGDGSFHKISSMNKKRDIGQISVKNFQFDICPYFAKIAVCSVSLHFHKEDTA